MIVLFCALLCAVVVINVNVVLDFNLFHLENEAIPPTRWLFSTLIPILLMFYGLKRKAVNYNGAALGVIVGITLSLANHAFLACLATFFFSSSRVTKYRSQMKRKIEIDFQGGKHLNKQAK